MAVGNNPPLAIENQGAIGLVSSGHGEISETEMSEAEIKKISADDVEEDSLTIVALGKSGAGKSTLINKLIDSDDIIEMSPNADTARIKLKKEEGKLIALDAPGLEPSKQKEWVKILKKVSKFGEGKANLFLLCIPVGPSNKFTDGTPEIMKYMQERMGKEVWKYCIVVFTFSNVARLIEGDRQKYEAYLQDYTDTFRKELCKFDIEGIDVVNIFQYGRNPKRIKNTIVTIPAGMDKKDDVIQGSNQTWSDYLADVIEDKCSGITKFDMKKYRHDLKLKKRGGVGAVTGILGGAALGAGAGAAVGVVGGPLGMIAGGMVGGGIGAIAGGVAGVSTGIAYNEGKDKLIKKNKDQD